ncbi:MAG: hypothetical protein ABI838_06320 [Chloroflexota bacterium]
MARPGSRAGSEPVAAPVTITVGPRLIAAAAGVVLLAVMAILMPPLVAAYLVLCGLAGVGLTYLSRLPLRLEERVAFGVVAGAMAATSAGFVIALAFGLAAGGVLAGLVAVLVVSALGWRYGMGCELAADLDDLGRRWGEPWRSAAHPWPVLALFLVCAAFSLYYLGGGYQFTAAGMLSTGQAFYGDWAAHLAYTGSFVYGANLPPEFPIDPGHRMAYPFLVDFFAASLVECGASLTSSLVLTSGYLSLALPAVVGLAGARLVGSYAGAAAGGLLLLLGGGLGFLDFFGDVSRLGAASVQHLPRFYTTDPDLNYQWMNPVLAYLVPQRSILVGLAVAAMVAALLYVAREQRGWQGYAFAGVVTGLTPLFHLHGYGTAVALAAAWMLIDRRPNYAVFFLPALALGIPVTLWMLAGDTASVRWLPGWMADLPPHHDGPIWFWLKNTGLFIPCLVAAQLWAGTVPSSFAIRFAPVWLWLLVPNLWVFQPWEWDNTKFFMFWFLFATLMVGALLVRLARMGLGGALVAAALAVVLCVSGGLDLARALDRSQMTATFIDRDGLAVAAWTRDHTEPKAIFAVAPQHNEPVAALAGRRVLAGYGGWLWSYGLADWTSRTDEEKKILAGDPAAADLVRREHVGYVAIGPQELAFGANVAYWSEHGDLVYEAGTYSVFRTRSR